MGEERDGWEGVELYLTDNGGNILSRTEYTCIIHSDTGTVSGAERPLPIPMATLSGATCSQHMTARR